MDQDNERRAHQAGEEQPVHWDDEIEYDYITETSRLTSVHILIFLDGFAPSIQLTNASSIGLTYISEYSGIDEFSEEELVNRMENVFVKLVSEEDRKAIAKEVHKEVTDKLCGAKGLLP